jgi:Concanavalin A-like lectin/glucanases superfamily
LKKIGFALGLLLALVIAAPASADSTLVGWWQLNEAAGAAANDSSGYGNNGTVSGGAQWVAGQRGSALSFDGTGMVQVPDSASLEPASAVSVTAWVKATGSPGEFKYIVSKGSLSCIAASYGLYTGPNGGINFYVSNNGGWSYALSPDGGAGIWDGNWHFVAGTYDGTAVHLYVDGSEVGSGTPRTGPIGYGLPNSNDLFVGHYAGCSGQDDFNGAIDEPQVWSRALSASDVLADMHPYSFTGFFQPVDNAPTVNTTKAGSAIPVKFSLGSDFGLGIFANGSPSSYQVSCTTGTPTDTIETTIAAGSSSLQYDPTSNQYTYVWKTDKAWAGTCRKLDLTLSDGSMHDALFQFSK